MELYHEAVHHHSEGLSLYALGQLDLVHRARIDDLFHAIAHAVRLAPTLDKDHVILVNLSGRGDKDMHTVAEYSGITL